MGRVYGILRVIMADGRRELALRILRTCIAGVNVESMEAIAVLGGFCRKPPNRCHSHGSSICIVKIDSSFDIRIVLIPFDYCISRRIRFDIYHNLITLPCIIICIEGRGYEPVEVYFHTVIIIKKLPITDS